MLQLKSSVTTTTALLLLLNEQVGLLQSRIIENDSKWITEKYEELNESINNVNDKNILLALIEWINLIIIDSDIKCTLILKILTILSKIGSNEIPESIKQSLINYNKQLTSLMWNSDLGIPKEIEQFIVDTTLLSFSIIIKSNR